MNYIILDLEWNQSPTGKGTENKEIPFEIIEIGAVKLDEDRNKISEFSELIKPQIYHEIHYKTEEIIHIKMEDLKNKETFPKVIKHFFDWCGDDYIFCTWGAMDLTEMQRNMKYFQVKELRDRPIKYYDIQKIFALIYDNAEITRTLEYAIDYINISKKESFHRALNDANYAALIFKQMDIDIAQKNYSLDYFYNPKRKEDEIKLVYENYSKEISTEFNSKELALQDKDVRSTVCYKCGKRATKKIRWFSSSAKVYYCLAYCKEHGYIVGKIRIKKTIDGKSFAVKTLKIVSEEEANLIKFKQEELRVKRRKKRNNKRLQEIKKRNNA
ncbi:3'-5' exonuclease [Anaeromicropila herbilytica]|uniref:Exonuclease domain-containing protein n=1 Tax=Anaeromicropila herbilytica TaxID=2785025 RepID=A0A7R7EQ54_9FIRM|nr:3'-5' exonuclease [Anaeromicropila herbilytica]BCN33010.1 hypothetical protein bsdtb5_43050 [Anaeromicropila herbilytica]